MSKREPGIPYRKDPDDVASLPKLGAKENIIGNRYIFAAKSGKVVKELGDTTAGTSKG